MKKINQIALFNILSTVLLKGISIVSGPLFSRLLGPDGFGVLSVYNVWVSVAAIVLTLQTQGTLVNARVEYPEGEQAAYQSSVLSLSLFSFLCAAAVILLFLNPISAALNMSGLLVIFMLIQAFGDYCANFLNSKFTYEFKADRNLYVSVGTALANLGLSLLFVLKLPREINYLGRIFGSVLVCAVVAVISCWLVFRKGKCFFHKKYWKFCLTLAIPVVFYSLSDLLLGHSDLVMLQRMAGDSASGVYGYAYYFGGIMFILFNALNNTWVAFYFEDMKQGRVEEIQKQEKNYLEVYTVLSTGFILLGPEVFRIYGGRDFWGGVPLVTLFVASYYLNFLCTFPVNLEYFHKKTQVVAVVTISSALVNLVLNYVFIRAYGMLGAALATMLSHILQYAMHFVYARFLLKKGVYPFRTYGWVPYTAAFVACMVLVLLTPNAFYLRWPLGAAIGLWELAQLKKRKRIF